MTIFAINGDATQVVCRKHILPVSRALDPTRDSTLHSIGLSHIVGHILSKAPLVERNFSTAIIEAIVAYWHFTISHGDAVLHSDVMQLLIPRESRQRVPLPELISQIKCPNTPLL